MTDVIEAMVIALVQSEDRQKQAGGFDYRVSLRAALSAAEESGWVLVPKEPTPTMFNAAARPMVCEGIGETAYKSSFTEGECRAVWGEMIQSSPEVK